MHGTQFVPGLRRKVLEHVLQNPDTHDQQHWNNHSFTRCCTTHCIGGWAIVLSGNNIETLHRTGLAKNLLGLTEAQADHLFYSLSDIGAVEFLKELVQEEERQITNHV